MIKKLYILRVVPQSLGLEQLKNQITVMMKAGLFSQIKFLKKFQTFIKAKEKKKQMYFLYTLH